MLYWNFKVILLFFLNLITTIYLARLLERVKETSLYTQNHDPIIKTECDIQTTRNLLN